MMESDLAGRAISHYKILEKLGEGGMGVVYQAEDTTLKRAVALKFLPPEMMRDPQAKARFLHEAQAAAALNHPNICTVYEIGEADGQTFIAMALIEGESLRDRIACGPLRLDEAITLASQVAEGLAAAHERSVIHRDIKPGNIMITAKGLTKIMDFGLARSQGQTRLTKTGATTGTIAYMSPEQSRGKNVDHRTDIWSFGVMLYEMVIGRRPFRGDYEQAVVRSIINDQPEPMTGLRTGVPVELERIVEKCLYKNPAERYQTVADLLADLHRLEREVAQETGAGRTTVLLRPPAEQRIRRWRWAVALVAVVTIAAWIVAQRIRPPETQPAPERKMLVVLPFENLGAPEDEYFADGITDEITARLAGIRELGIIARTSATRYKNTDKTIRQIGEELGVDYVLEGTIRWQRVSETESQVRVTPQLIAVTDECHLWADIYQEDMADIFEMQADIAEHVAEALAVALLEPARQQLRAMPTENLDAYHAYLRGMERWAIPDLSVEGLLLATDMFERASDLDPRFALTYAELSMTHSMQYIQGYDWSEERLGKAKAAADRALELEPELPEAHLALGLYYRTSHEYDRALEAFTAADGIRPDDVRVALEVSAVRRMQGRFEEAIDVLETAVDLDPQSAAVAYEMAFNSRALGRYAQAERHYDRVIALAPDQVRGYAEKAWLYRVWQGELEQARATLEDIPYNRGYDWKLAWYYQEYYERDFQSALDRLASLPRTAFRDLVRGEILQLIGDSEQSRTSFETARTYLDSLVAMRPDYWEMHRLRGCAYAHLDRREDAAREGRLCVELARASGDINSLWSATRTMAVIYTILGDQDAAVELLDHLLSTAPYLVSVPMLRLEPRWDPLREHPGFKRLLEDYSESGS